MASSKPLHTFPSTILSHLPSSTDAGSADLPDSDPLDPDRSGRDGPPEVPPFPRGRYRACRGLPPGSIPGPSGDRRPLVSARRIRSVPRGRVGSATPSTQGSGDITEQSATGSVDDPASARDPGTGGSIGDRGPRPPVDPWPGRGTRLPVGRRRVPRCERRKQPDGEPSSADIERRARPALPRAELCHRHRQGGGVGFTAIRPVRRQRTTPSSGTRFALRAPARW